MGLRVRGRDVAGECGVSGRPLHTAVVQRVCGETEQAQCQVEEFHQCGRSLGLRLWPEAPKQDLLALSLGAEPSTR